MEKASERWVDIGSDLVEAYRDLVAIKVVEKASTGASAGIIGILSLMSISFVMLFGGLGLAWWFGQILDNMIAGFFIVGGAYLVILAVLLMASKKVLIPKIRNFIIRKIYEEN